MTGQDRVNMKSDVAGQGRDRVMKEQDRPWQGVKNHPVDTSGADACKYLCIAAGHCKKNCDLQ